MAFLRIICAQRSTNLVYSYSGSGSSSITASSNSSIGTSSGSALQFYHFGLIQKANRCKSTSSINRSSSSSSSNSSSSNIANRSNNNNKSKNNIVTLKNSQGVRYASYNVRPNDISNNKQPQQQQQHQQSYVHNGELKQDFRRQQQQQQHYHYQQQLRHYYNIKSHQKVLTKALLLSTTLTTTPTLLRTTAAAAVAAAASASSSDTTSLRTLSSLSTTKRFLQTDATKSQIVTQAASLNQNATTATTTTTERFRPPPPKIPENPQRDPLDVSFNNPHAAFKSKTTSELIRAYVVYMICSFEKIVEHNMAIMKFFKGIMGDKLFEMAMKSTFYGHFVAGEDRWKIVPTLERLRSFGVKPILDYSVEEDLSQEEAEKREVEATTSTSFVSKEDALPQYQVDKTFADRRYKVNSARTYFYLNEATCERNMEIFIKCLEAVAGATFGTGITAIKLTALGRPQLLLQLSEVISKARSYMEDLAGGGGNVLNYHKTIKDLEKYYASLGMDNKEVNDFLKNVTSDKDGILHLFPWTGIVNDEFQLSDTFRVPDPKTGQMRRLISQIPPKEEEMFRNMIRRVNTIVKTAEDLDVRIMIDAEQTYFQPAISRITLEMMRKYNKEKAIVFNTYQCYLRETYREVTTDLEQAKRQNFYFGAKLVRGAYMEQERARAAALGYPDPVNENFEATTEMYHKTLTECLRRIKDLKDSGEDAKKIGIMVASHNEDTVRYAIEKMKEIGISPEDKVICFGQLLGMCDYITFPLGQAGYSAYKYIPYGPVQEVLPYLSRRAQENKGVLKKIQKEKRLLLAEIFRRLRTGQLFYKPKGNYVPI